LGDVRGDAVECRRTVPKDRVNITDPCRCNRPSIGAGICSTALFLVCIGVMPLYSLVRVKHPDWLILGERTAWTKEVEEYVTCHRRMMLNGVCERGRHFHKALIDRVAPHI
jgi:hypothetical protein